jgi:hypothetical protein
MIICLILNRYVSILHEILRHLIFKDQQKIMLRFGYLDKIGEFFKTGYEK